ncbi:MAG TPA: S1 RNA-binding domain-containing protein, partial [Bacteroidetes bacterium]|nr:S1 RNA-binding domain-containing protein [Bacteroidota bacterium]
YNRLVAPAIEREIRNALTDRAEEHAIQVFARNLRALLLTPPVRGKVIMGIDPGYRTGCKVAVIDPTGKYLEGTTIYPHEPQRRWNEAKVVIEELIEKHNVDIVAIGNGTASRETEMLVAEVIAELEGEREVVYTIVSEAGASVYSASPVAKKEFPDLEASMRGNISIARRLLDPLSELVKIEPRSLGVGLYQHDVDQNRLAEALDRVVESAVNLVGVDLNTASSSLLKYVSGINSRVAENIVKYREEHGAFRSREELKKVKGLGEHAFVQSAGFLRIPEAENFFDSTAVHPESYEAAEKLLQVLGLTVDEVRRSGHLVRQRIEEKGESLEHLAEVCGVGRETLADIVDSLEKPNRDPRDEMPKPIFRSDVLKIEDLAPGMILKGTVRNVVDFGAFVDIGVKQDGLVHLSKMSKRYIKNPLDVVSVGDVVEVKVLKVDPERGRIALSMVLDD